MSIFKSTRCTICKTHRGNRFCVRTGKNICWHCCNEKRVDQKCSENCKYALKKTSDDLFQLKTNADSKSEYNDLLKNEIKLWVRKPQELFDEKLPIKMGETEEGRKELFELFNKIPLENRTPLIYLKSMLKLDNLEVPSEEQNPEDIASIFLDKIIEQDWDTTISYLYKSKQYGKEMFTANYKKRMESNKIINKLTSYDLISSAMTKEKDKALVFFELNGKYDLTLSLVSADKDWKIEKKIFGKPELYNGESDAHKQIAVLLSKNENSNAYDLLKKYSALYPDSPDLKYYWGLYHSLNKNSEKSKKFFIDAIEIDPDFTEAKYNYAFLLHTENKISDAKELYYEILEVDENEPKTLNNLASILIDENKLAEAKELLERCLKEVPDFEVAKQNLERIK